MGVEETTEGAKREKKMQTLREKGAPLYLKQ